MIIKVRTNTMIGIYHMGRNSSMINELTSDMINAVKKDNARGERFLVSRTDMQLIYAISNL